MCEEVFAMSIEQRAVSKRHFREGGTHCAKMETGCRGAMKHGDATPRQRRESGNGKLATDKTHGDMSRQAGRLATGHAVCACQLHPAGFLTHNDTPPPCSSPTPQTTDLARTAFWKGKAPSSCMGSCCLHTAQMHLLPVFTSKRLSRHVNQLSIWAINV